MEMTMSIAKLSAIVKKTAATVNDFVKQKNKIKEKMEKLQADLDMIQSQQDLFEAPIKQATGGYTTEELVITKVVEVGTNKDGKPIRATRYELRYPDTVVPPAADEVAEPENTEEVSEDVPTFDTSAHTFVSESDTQMEVNNDEESL